MVAHLGTVKVLVDWRAILIRGDSAVRPNGAHARVEAFHRDGWVYEEKVDGYRMLAYKDRTRTRLISRNHIDHTARHPELAAAIDALPASSFVLDGELAVFDAQLRSRFDWLRHRPGTEVATLPVFIAFDLL